MKNLSSDTHAHDAAQDKELLELLKTAEDAGEAPGDDDESTVGETPDPTPPPEDRGAGTTDAAWGEEPTKTEGEPALHFSDEAVRQFRQGREKFLEKYFDSPSSSGPAEKQLVGQHFQHASSGQFETSSPTLSDKSKLQKTSGVQTLLERVRKTAGRH